MKLGHRLPEAAWQVFSMLTSGAELFPQTPVWLGSVVKKFIRTSDWLLESMAGDSARLGHLPATIPSFPSARAKQICLIKLSWKKIETSPANVIRHHIPKPTLVFHHIVPLVCDPLTCFLGFLWCEDYQTLVLADHVLEQRPVATALWHFCHWEPILHKARSIEHFRQGPCSGVVFQENRDYFWRVCIKEYLDFFEDIDGWLLNRKNTEGKSNSGLELQHKCTYFSGHRTTGEKNV